jgi:DNA repair protein RadA/Sms
LKAKPKPESDGRSSLATLGSIKPPERMDTGSPEFNKVLGGGLVQGSVVVVTGPPGQGKSTILLQTANTIAQGKKTVLYTSGEQSRDDIGFLAARLNCLNPNVDVLGNEGDIYKIVEEAEGKKPALLVVDSVNTAFMDDVEADVNSARQIEAVTNYLTSFAKTAGITILLVCHVKKDGEMSGPKVMEHLVDAVMFFDPYFGEDGDDEDDAKYRQLSSGKNRYGASGVRATVEMTEGGIRSPQKVTSKYLVLE